GQFREIERPFLTENQLKSKPQMTGMLYGFGLAKRVQVSPMPYGDWPRITIAPEILPGPEAQNQTSSLTPETDQGAQVAPQFPPGNPAPEANQNRVSSPETTAAEADQLKNLY